MNPYYSPSDPAPPPEYAQHSAKAQKSSGKIAKTDRQNPTKHSSRSHARIVFLRVMELLSIALSFLYRSRIARFITTKISMDIVVEVTAVFGKDAGHRLSTFLALLTAEPALIAVFVTALILVLEMLFWIIRRARK